MNPAPADSFAQLVNDLSFLSSLVEVHLMLYRIKEPSSILPFFVHLRLQKFALIFGDLQEPHSDIANTIFRDAYEQRSSKEPSTLRELTLISLDSDAPANCATLESLARIATNCVGLEKLKISLGRGFATSVPSGLSIDDWLKELRRSPPSASKLQELSIPETATPPPLLFHNADTLAQILDHLFPSLQDIKPLGKPELRYWKDYWSQIEQQRQLYRKIRMLTASSW